MPKLRKRDKLVTTLWFRESSDDNWRKVTSFIDISEKRAHFYADLKNVKHSYGMWWVADNQPSKSKVPDGKEHL